MAGPAGVLKAACARQGARSCPSPLMEVESDLTHRRASGRCLCTLSYRLVRAPSRRAGPIRGASATGVWAAVRTAMGWPVVKSAVARGKLVPLRFLVIVHFQPPPSQVDRPSCRVVRVAVWARSCGRRTLGVSYLRSSTGRARPVPDRANDVRCVTALASPPWTKPPPSQTDISWDGEWVRLALIK